MKVNLNIFSQRQADVDSIVNDNVDSRCQLMIMTMTLMTRPLTARQNLDAVRVAGHWHLIKPGARATHPPNLKMLVKSKI